MESNWWTLSLEKFPYKLIQRFYYPILICVIFTLLHLYFFYNLPVWWFFFAELGMLLSLFFLERVMPVDTNTEDSWAHFRVDIFHLFFYVALFIYPAPGSSIVFSIYQTLSDFAAHFEIFFPLIPGLAKLSPWKAFFIALIVAEFGTYWCHRLLFHSRFWIAHRCHHSSIRVYTMMLYRQHVLDSLAINLSHFLLLLILGFDNKVVIATVIFFYVCSQMAHSNLDLHNPWLGKILLTNKIHRIHHMTDTTCSNSNFGICHLFWDHVAGTYRSVYPENYTYGLPSPSDYPAKNFWGQIIDPFLSQGMKKKIMKYWG